MDLRAAGAALLLAFSLMRMGPPRSSAADPLAGSPGPWKVAVVLYDHPKAANVSVGDATLLPDDTLFVPLAVAWRDSAEAFAHVRGYDWYEAADTLRLTLFSRDRGLSWNVHKDPPPQRSLRARDGTLVRLRWLGYQHHPLEEQARWERAGYWLYLIPEKRLFATTGDFVVESSHDGGHSWSSRKMELPHRAFLAGYGMATARLLSDGTILMPVFGYLTRRHKTYAASVARSADGGRTWDLITVAQDERPEAVSAQDIPSGAIWSQFPESAGFDEAQVVETGKPGRVLAIIEESRSKDLYSCVSEDYGRTWTQPKPTGMRGNTPLLLRLRSGKLACAFTQRTQDGGMRVCLSRDDGQTWDAEHTIVLKDDNARTRGQCLWNLVQFSDGTLFASGWATKRGCGGGDEVSYAIGFRFTEEFVTPLRVGPR